ncbi:MAG: PEP-CTERM sorting domain-containing protein [Proteobacteria bacterium]|nr:PEP-CTERM sorting domain-containing protein [Pseudomonadota bacterium]
MLNGKRGRGLWLALALGVSTFATTGPAAAAPIGVGYTVSTIATPAVPTGDVLVVGDALFVGVGSFGAQSLVRIDAGGATTLATGFASLAGLAYDAAGDRLIAGDNGLEFSSSGSGDTIYGISDPTNTAGGFAAADIELLPSGSIASLADLVLDPNDATGNTLFASDATGPPGSVLRVDLLLSDVTSVQTVAPFAAGLAATNDTLYVGTAAFPPEGFVFTTALPGGDGSLDPLVSGLPGAFDLEIASDGTLLVTAGDRILRLDPDTGDVLEVVATGFAFAGGLFEADGLIYALDSDFASPVAAVYVFAPIPEPGTAALLALGAGLLAWRRQSSTA